MLRMFKKALSKVSSLSKQFSSTIRELKEKRKKEAERRFLSKPYYQKRKKDFGDYFFGGLGGLAALGVGLGLIGGSILLSGGIGALGLVTYGLYKYVRREKEDERRAYHSILKKRLGFNLYGYSNLQDYFQAIDSKIKEEDFEKALEWLKDYQRIESLGRRIDRKYVWNEVYRFALDRYEESKKYFGKKIKEAERKIREYEQKIQKKRREIERIKESLDFYQGKEEIEKKYDKMVESYYSLSKLREEIKREKERMARYKNFLDDFYLLLEKDLYPTVNAVIRYDAKVVQPTLTIF